MFEPQIDFRFCILRIALIYSVSILFFYFTNGFIAIGKPRYQLKNVVINAVYFKLKIKVQCILLVRKNRHPRKDMCKERKEKI